MNDTVSTEQVIQLVKEALADSERAIRSHPAETVQVYEEGARAHREGLALAQETEWSHSLRLTLEQLGLIHRYLFAIAFMSAWWSLSGDKKRRDKATSVACLLVAGAGLDSEEALRHIIRYEKAWRGNLAAENLSPKRSLG